MVTGSRVSRHRKRKPFYKKWWIWLLTIVVITLLYFIFRPQEKIFIDLNNDTATLDKKTEAKFHFTTNSGNKYTITDLSNNKKMGTDTADTGQEQLTFYNAGKYKVTVYKNGEKESKELTVKPRKISINELLKNSSSDNTTTKKSTPKPSAPQPMPFGQSNMVGNGNMVANVTINSVQRVDPNYDMVTDISHNYEGMQQYVVVNYTVSSVKGDIPLDDFDGSELSIADSNGTIGTQSSNRDNGTPDTLSEGQNADLRIGVGLKSSGNDITIKFNNSTWKGQIQ